MASKYGSEKSTFFLRSSVIVIPAAARSHWSELRNAPVLKFSKGVSTMACFTPRSPATRSISDTSKPCTLPSISDWKGGYGRWVQVVS